MPAPLSTAEPLPSTFTRRPVVKTEAEIKAEERILAKKVRKSILNYSFPSFLLGTRRAGERRDIYGSGSQYSP